MRARDRRVAAVICANGLGHFRRVLEVSHALVRLVPGVRLDLVCGRWQLDRMRDWGTAGALAADPRVGWVHDAMEPGVRWSPDPAVYGDGRLKAWVRRLEDARVLEGADLVLSDNLAGVLELRPDAVLMGSFLWSDVLDGAFPDSPEAREFAAWERGLLDRNRPPMLCVRDIAMPSLASRTRPVPLPWMRSGEGRPPARRTPTGTRIRVAFLVGATGAADPLAAGIAEALLERGAEVALPAAIHGPFRDRPGASLFRFVPSDFLACDVALGRPGLGAVHDCLFYGLPMALVQEADNPELAHNGARIEALGLGIHLGLGLSPGRIAERLLEFAVPGTLEPIRDRMAATPLDGIERAAEWLRDRLLSS